MVERLFIRVLVGATLCMTLATFMLAPVPEDARGHPVLPAVALGQVGLYRLEVALLAFYGGLLLITPAFSGLARGRLPIEISARGAKFAVEVDQPEAPQKAMIEELRQATKGLAEEVATTQVNIQLLQEHTRSDSTKPKVELKDD
jgi:hypothetical protein